MKAVPVFGALLLGVACATTSPVPIHAGDVCFNCRRTITDTQLAAEVIDDSAHAFKFSSVGCLTAYLRDHPQEGVKALFVTDYNAGKLFPAKDAHFVRFVVDPKVNALDYAAFRSESAAGAFAKEKRASVVRWDDARKDETITHAD